MAILEGSFCLRAHNFTGRTLARRQKFGRIFNPAELENSRVLGVVPKIGFLISLRVFQNVLTRCSRKMTNLLRSDLTRKSGPNKLFQKGDPLNDIFLLGFCNEFNPFS